MLSRGAWTGVSCDGLFLIFDSHAHIHNGDGSGAIPEAKKHVKDGCKKCASDDTYLDAHGDLFVNGEEISA
jgi:hypothetical protein